jgi:hypothetical protein
MPLPVVARADKAVEAAMKDKSSDPRHRFAGAVTDAAAGEGIGGA